MQADTSTVQRYEAELKALKDRCATLEQGERIARYSAVLQSMEDDGWPIEAAEELERCQNYSQEQFDQHCADIKKYGEHSRRPHGPAIRGRRRSRGSRRGLCSAVILAGLTWWHRSVRVWAGGLRRAAILGGRAARRCGLLADRDGLRPGPLPCGGCRPSCRGDATSVAAGGRPDRVRVATARDESPVAYTTRL